MANRPLKKSAPGPSDPAFGVVPGIAHREIEGQTLLLLPGRASIYTLNTAGQVVWRELVKGRRLSQITATLARRFGLPGPQARADVERLLRDLQRRAIIRPARGHR
jgi:hypothetical protein